MASASLDSSTASSLEARPRLNTIDGTMCAREVAGGLPCIAPRSSSAPTCSRRGRVCSGMLAVDSSRMTSPSLSCASPRATDW